jgi:hypothetical protein
LIPPIRVDIPAARITADTERGCKSFSFYTPLAGCVAAVKELLLALSHSVAYKKAPGQWRLG